jgi:hypothetical protein
VSLLGMGQKLKFIAEPRTVSVSVNPWYLTVSFFLICLQIVGCPFRSVIIL